MSLLIITAGIASSDTVVYVVALVLFAIFAMLQQLKVTPFLRAESVST